MPGWCCDEYPVHPLTQILNVYRLCMLCRGFVKGIGKNLTTHTGTFKDSHVTCASAEIVYRKTNEFIRWIRENL